jgi:membrane protease YdiL (CAAX protease family)
VLLGAVLLAGGVIVPMMEGYVPLQNLVLPSPTDSMAELEGVMTDTSPLLLFFLLVLSPGIWEEMVFRGAFLGLLRRVGTGRRAVVLSSVFFAAVHLSVFRFGPTFLLGVMLAALTVTTGSLVPAMIFHMVYNGVMVLGERLLPDVVAAWEGPLGWGGSVVLLVVGILLVRSGRRGTTSEPGD